MSTYQSTLENCGGIYRHNLLLQQKNHKESLWGQKLANQADVKVWTQILVIFGSEQTCFYFLFLLKHVNFGKYNNRHSLKVSIECIHMRMFTNFFLFKKCLKFKYCVRQHFRKKNMTNHYILEVSIECLQMYIFSDYFSF